MVVGRSGNESPSSGQADSKDGEAPVFDQRDGVHSKPFLCVLDLGARYTDTVNS